MAPSSWLLALMMLALSGGVALAQTQDAIAEQLNDEGKEFMLNRNPAEAAKRFFDAAARSPNPRYFYNLCKAYHFQGMFFEAMDACASARKNNPDEDLSKKIAAQEDAVRTAAKEQNIDLSKPPTKEPDPDEGTDPDPSHPVDPTRPTVQPVRGVPPKDLYAVIAPRHEYVWTLGADLLFGNASIDSDSMYGASFTGVRLRLDYMLLPSSRVGGQAYVDFLQIGKGDAGVNLSVTNIGGAVYKHLCFGRTCLTPLGGVQIGALDDATLGNNTFESFSASLRLEGGASIALGTRYEHVFGAQAGIMAYSKPSDSESLAFSRGGALAYLGIGYTYRFNTPFGSAPILGLE
ncbi:MAG: hypothetical protein R3B48_01260 [Kofleriaceae bacterium]